MNNLRSKQIPIITILGFIIPGVLLANQIIKLRRTPQLAFEYHLEYDNNIFLYSPEALEEFRNQIRAYRFPFRTHDDLIANYKISFNFPLRILVKRTDFTVNYTAKTYTVNTIKSYQIINPYLQVQMLPDLVFRFSYLLIPNYLIRYYKDPLSSRTQYIPCQFTEQLFTLSFRYKFSSFWINSFIRYQLDDYIKNFNFYDGTAWRYGMQMAFPITKNTTLQTNWERKHNNAVGPVPDISYLEDKIACEWQITISKKVFMSTGLEYAYRQYTTTNPITIDPYHYQRKDRTYSINFNCSYQFKHNWRLVGDYLYTFRRVTAPSLIDITEIKNYNNYKITLGVNFNVSVQTRKADEE
ncbi:MAG: hypothetical protein ABIK73_05955 [candidate division WOR-3 bacterium]